MYKLLLCLRYLRTRYIALASIISVMLGVATMIVVNSVMAGFTNEMRDRIHGFLADVVVETRGMNGIADSQAILERIDEAAGEYISNMTPTVDAPGMISIEDPITGESYTQQVQIVAIDPDGKAAVGPLRTYLDSFNAVTEDGVVVRPALRKPTDPLGWELTPEQARYRQIMQEQKRLYLEQNRVGGFGQPLKSDSADRSKDQIPQFEDGESVEGDSAENESAAEGLQDGSANESAPESEDEKTRPDVPDFDELFVPPTELVDSSEVSPQRPSDPFTPSETSPPIDLGALRSARVYLGDGLASFQGRDPETGKTRKYTIVNPGDDIILTTVTAATPPAPVSFSATVVDIFRSGMSEYDSGLVLMNIKELQKNRGMHLDDAITSVQIKLKDYNDAPQAVALIKSAFLPGEVSVKTWESKQGLLLSAVEVETAILNVLLFMIIAVAGFGILAIFFMIVVEKTRDIGILKSLGAGSHGVMAIFLSYGLGLGIVGSAAGVTIGILFVGYINEIEDVLSWITGRRVFDEKIYYFAEIPTQINPLMVFWVAVGAIAIAVMASVLPARRASRLHPVRALRYE